MNAETPVAPIPVLGQGLRPRQVAGTRDEVNPLHEASRLVAGHDHDLLAARDDVVGAAAAREPNLRPVGIADVAGVDVSELVDLTGADEAVVVAAALPVQEDLVDRRDHERVVGGAHLVGGDRQPAREHPRAD